MRLTLLITLSIILGFILATLAFKDGWNKQVYHLEWGQSLHNPTKDCVSFWWKNDETSSSGKNIFCVNNNYSRN